MKKTSDIELCPVCNRELVTVNVDEHHLIPKCKKGKEKHRIHRICHEKIHATYTEKELAEWYNTWQRLKDSEEIGKFVKWVQKKAPDFLDKTINANRKSGKRKR